ncbi:Aldo/keto reductase [Phellopilus nigrolimitatus]|nr:Aldo/keto reductase [Phellopilus nigrolimitatus]
MPFGSIKLNDGNEIPAIAFGTGTELLRKDATASVGMALENGFTHIDTAQTVYENEEFVGNALRDEALPRSEVYITTKYGGGKVSEAILDSLKKLGLKQVDLYLFHSPAIVDGTIENTWRGLEKIKDSGLAKSIGVSNFTVQQLQDLAKTARIKPSVNQVRVSCLAPVLHVISRILNTSVFSELDRLHPYNWVQNKDLVTYASKQGIVLEAFGSLAPITKTPGGPVDQVLSNIGERIGATPAQVIFSWLKSKDIVIVTTTTKKERLEEYLAVADLHNSLFLDRVAELTDAEITAIEEAGAKGPPSSFRSLMRKKAAFRLIAVTVTATLLYGARCLFA